MTRRIVEVGEPERVPVASVLATTAFRRRSGLDLRSYDLDATAEMIIAAAKFLDERQPGEIAVRVAQPAKGGAVIDVNTEDGPFLVSSLTAELTRQGFGTRDVIHPILGVERGEDGTVHEILPARTAAHRESWIHVRLQDRLDEEERQRLQDDVLSVMRDARQVTRDYRAFKDRILEMARATEVNGRTRYAEEDVREVTAFLRWLLDDHFVFLGALDYVAEEDGVQPVPGSGLGILSGEGDTDAAVPGEGLLDHPDVGEHGDDLLVVTRTDRRARVHRNERMIFLGLKQLDGDRVVGERRVLGLLSQKAFAEPATAIPVLRRKLRAILEREDIVDHSHDERAMRTLFEAIPKYELFAVQTEDLRATLVDLLESQKRQLVRMVVRAERHGASALVTLPRDRFNADLRRSVQKLLVRRLGGTNVDYHLSLTEGDQALMHFTLATEEAQPSARLDDLQRDVVELARTWQDRLRAALQRSAEVAEPALLAARWPDVLPATYTAGTEPEKAVGDVLELDALVFGSIATDLRVRVVRSEPGRLTIKLFKRGEGIELSTVLPMLESLGLTAIEEVPHRLEIRSGGDHGIVHIHAVEVRGAGLDDLDIDDDGRRLSEALLAVWQQRCEADSLNRLVLVAGLTWREVGILRAYRRYRRQVGTSFTEHFQNEALCRYPKIARALVELFTARFDPALVDEGDLDAEGARQRVLDGLEDVTRLDQDRILRGYLGLIDATLRTNVFVEPTRRWLSLKLDSARVPDVPKPVPHREIYVYSPQMEGVHLRAGDVARGGLRWSDRQEDVRTEVLGLMKAQVTKNSLIVPTGAKGGFVLKRPPDDAAELREAVRAQYEVFIHGMLDLTDNVRGGRVVPPSGVVRRDGDDPYLVVAADRGTATFSDVANSISEEYGYWLADAFASGGSRGYDHKEMGITARGAWVAVARHFAELDIEVQSESIRVVGIGDMSGDVFGNGMLRSRAVKLVAAFDHRDILIDPDPDPEAAFAERKRLYALPRSSWQDYDRDIISPGGGVWSRFVKSVPLSDEVRRLLRVDAAELSPPELIRAILQAPVDLLFAGGVGTFVKAPDESNDEVGDRSNDAIRVDADTVGARVIGEGGNLAVTQRGRIAFARRGGRVNLDAIDNAGGVATSDAEVNLKILLQAAMDAGAIEADERDTVLEEVQEEVAQGVLHLVWRQAWAISREVSRSPGGMEAYAQLLTDLEETGRTDRRVDVLPSPEEMQRRREAGAGMTRPELGIMLGASKRDLTTRLLRSGVPDGPALRPLLEESFPRSVAERFDELLDGHRLRRELVATRLSGEIVDRMGITYISRTAHERGCSAADVAASYWVAREVIGAADDWAAVDALEGRVVPALQFDLDAEIHDLVDACTRAYLRERSDRSMAELIAADREAFAALERYVDALGGEHAALRTRQVRRWTDVGIDEGLAERMATLSELALAPDVAAAARRLERPVDDVADAFITVTDRLPLDELHRHLERVTPVGHWERWESLALVDELRELRRYTATAALAGHDGSGPEAVEAYLSAREVVLSRVDTLMQRLKRDPDGGLAAAAVVISALRGIND